MSTHTKHAPEPWGVRVAGYYVSIAPLFEGEIAGDGNFDVCSMYESGYHPSGGHKEEKEANAARIVACVNACAGLNPEAIADVVGALEAMVKTVSGLRQTTLAVEAQLVVARAALAALKGAAPSGDCASQGGE